MAWSKTHDLAVVTGTYTKGGEEKKRYLNVGQVITNDADGGQMFMVRRSFAPAGIPPRNDDDEYIALFKFAVREKDGAAPTREPAKAPSGGSVDDDIPFAPAFGG